MLNQEQVLGFVRHGLTLVGGILIAAGWGDESTWTELSGAVMSIVGVAWSWWAKSHTSA